MSSRVTQVTDNFEPRTIKPRTRTYKRLPIIVVGRDELIYEDGTIAPLRDLDTNLPAMPSTLFVTIGSGDFLAHLDEIFSKSHPTKWQWRVSDQRKHLRKPGDGELLATRVTCVTHYFGFKGGQYHKVIDPVVMYGKSLDDVWQDSGPFDVRLLRWGIQIRNFCDENGLEVRPTIGAIAAQFLTDKRFYPRARRKVPHQINARAREHLPGNHYALGPVPSPSEYFSAWYLDQHRAHHYHARTTPLPNADHLYAYGHFVNLGKIAFDITAVPENFTGLYCLKLQFPTLAENPVLSGMSHWLRSRDEHHFVFSNELPLLLDMGYKVTGVIAAWGSFQRDEGIARYATWCGQQLDSYGDKPWLKPILLATYGTLATRPTRGEAVFRMAKRGQQVNLITGRGELTGLLVQRSAKLDPRVANVIHRGMIEAATRAESIGLARWLAHEGYRPLSIYADAVIIENDDKPLPDFLPEPWRLKSELTHLQFVTKQAFISGEMTKLPGVSAELRRYARGQQGHAPRMTDRQYNRWQVEHGAAYDADNNIIRKDAPAPSHQQLTLVPPSKGKHNGRS